MGANLIGDFVSVLSPGTFERVKQQINHAGLHDGFVPRHPDRVRQALKPAANHDQDVLDTPVLDLREYESQYFVPSPSPSWPAQITRCHAHRSC